MNGFATGSRRLGPLTVSSVGLGCMGMSAYYGPPDDERSTRVIRAALDHGVTLLDTADVFADGANEELVGRAVAGRRDEVVIATKFGTFQGEGGTPEQVRRACERSLRRLGVDTIDLYQQFRIDPGVPVEETWGALHELVVEGKVRHLGLCEVSPATLRRAHAVHPVAVVQTEYALWMRDVEVDGVLDTARELGIGIVAACPLGRGMLTGAIRGLDDLAPTDSRRKNPRFMGDNLARNRDLLPLLREVAEAHGGTPAQVALAWLLAQGDDVVVIPGTTRTDHLEENLAAAWLTLDAETLQRLSAAFEPGCAAGDRYSNLSWVYA